MLSIIHLKSTQQAFCMFGGQDYTTTYLSLGHTRQYPCEIDHEVTAAMRDDGKVGILSLRHLLWQFYLQTLLLLLVLVHLYNI